MYQPDALTWAARYYARAMNTLTPVARAAIEQNPRECLPIALGHAQGERDALDAIVQSIKSLVDEHEPPPKKPKPGQNRKRKGG